MLFSILVSEQKNLLKKLIKIMNILSLLNDILIKMKNEDHIVIDNNNDINDSFCEECKNEDESVKQNLIMYSYKICNSCNISKKIFPL
jgi:hypothetical protein